MAQAAPTYDLTLLLDGDAPEEVRTRVVGEVERAISAQGSLVGRHDWGRRHTAYPIRHKEEAEYRLFQFQGPPALLDSLRRSLRITDGVVRFRLIKLAPGTPPPPEPRPEPRSEPRGEARGEARAEAPASTRQEPAPAPAEPAPAPAEPAPAPAEPTPAPAEPTGGSETQG